MREHGHRPGERRASTTAGDRPAAPGLTDLVVRLGRGERALTPALVEADGSQLSYAALADRLDAAILDHAERRHEVRILTIRPTVDDIVDYLACLGAGRPVLLADPARPDRVAELERRFVSDDATRPRPHRDLALLLPTSGSTGAPRLVRLSHTNVVANATSIADYLGLGPDDVGLTVLPLHYCYGLSVLHSHLLVGASVVLTDTSVADAGFVDLAARHRVTNLAGVPHSFALMDRTGFAERTWPELRFLTQAGGKMAADDVRRWAGLGARRGWDLFVMYGQTEATARMAYLPPEAAATHPHLVGRAIPGGRFEIVDDDGATIEPDLDALAASAEGALIYHGPNVMMGYASDLAELADPPGPPRRDTGDRARWSSEGMVEITGRASRFLKLFGLRIDLDQIERAAADAELALWATGDDSGLVVAVADLDVTEARAWLATIVSLPPAAVAVVEVAEVPRLSNGKVDYPAIREAAASLESDPAPSSGPLDVTALVADALGRSDVGPDDSFAGLGGDSLSYVAVSSELSTAGIDLPLDWPQRPLRELQRLASGATRRDTRGALGRLIGSRALETDVALRAVAIAAIVASHFELLTLEGGAHVLLAVIGANLARFHVPAVWAAAGPSPLLWAAGRVAVPTLVWTFLAGIAGWLGLADAAVSWVNFALVTNVVVDSPGSTKYWFVEVMVQLFVALALLASSRRVRQAAIARPEVAGLALLAAGLALRFGLHAWWDPAPYDEKLPTMVLWLVGVGWLAQVHRSNGAPLGARLALSGVIVCGSATLFDSLERNLFIGVGLLVLVWVPRLSVPAVVFVPVSTLAAASLYIYLTHFQLTAPLGLDDPALRTGVALVGGVAVARVAQPVMTWGERHLRAALG